MIKKIIGISSLEETEDTLFATLLVILNRRAEPPQVMARDVGYGRQRPHGDTPAPPSFSVAHYSKAAG